MYNYQLMPLVQTEDLIDAQEVARIIGLAHRNAVSGYQRRYPDMPRPIVDLGPKRPLLWLRPQIETWAAGRPAIRRGRPRDPSGSRPLAEVPIQSDANAPRRGGGGSGGVLDEARARRKHTALTGAATALGRTSRPRLVSGVVTFQWVKCVQCESIIDDARCRSHRTVSVLGQALPRRVREIRRLNLAAGSSECWVCYPTRTTHSDFAPSECAKPLTTLWSISQFHRAKITGSAFCCVPCRSRRESSSCACRRPWRNPRSSVNSSTLTLSARSFPGLTRRRL